MKRKNMYENCNLCPRKCGIDRTAGKRGACGADEKIKIARAALHFWEEPCISGENGSGAVFFSGCQLHCEFCQNKDISDCAAGKTVDAGRLTEIFLELKEQGAYNINLVTPSHFAPSVIEALEDAKRQGMDLPVVYNTGGYDSVDTIKLFEGIVDVYLPDFKYMDENLALRFSGVKNYPDVAKAAIREMVRQQPKAVFDGYDMIKSGVIVRQLLLPGHVKDAMHILSYLHDTYGEKIYISMMSQYTPVRKFIEHTELNRKVTKREYERYIQYAMDIGIENGFIQEGDVAEESFIPEFNGFGV